MTRNALPHSTSANRWLRLAMFRWIVFLIGTVGTTGLAPLLAGDGDITIRTSRGIVVLTNPSKLEGEFALKSAQGAAEEALSASTAQAAALAKEETKLVEDAAQLKEKRDAAQKELDKRSDRYKQDLDRYKTELAEYKQSLNTYKSDVATQRAQVQTSDALPPSQRSPSTVSRLNAWKGQLDRQEDTLDARQQTLRSEKSRLDTQRQSIADFQRQSEATLADLADKLKTRAGQLTLKQDEAYRQLKQCHEYALEIRRILSAKYKVDASTASSANWRAAEETLKELSNRGFDGNNSKPPLTERKKDTEFFKKP